jgi:recombination protein RecR
MNYSSKLLENAVSEISKLPGIGKKTALRLALHLLKQDEQYVEALGNSLIKLKKEVNYCKVCNNLSESEVCEICSNPRRKQKEICVVQDIRDILAIENTGQYTGLYHVLGGIISPMDGIGPEDLNIRNLLQRIKTGEVEEVIFALPTTVEGDTTNFYLYKLLKDLDIKVTSIARGVSIGDDIEYTDEVTLGRSILNRQLYSG